MPAPFPYSTVIPVFETYQERWQYENARQLAIFAISSTDWAIAPDAPFTAEQKAEIFAYRAFFFTPYNKNTWYQDPNNPFLSSAPPIPDCIYP